MAIDDRWLRTMKLTDSGELHEGDDYHYDKWTIDGSESGKVYESLRNSDARLIKNRDFPQFTQAILIEKYTFRSFYGKMLQKYAFCFSWYGKRIYFSDREELGKFTRDRFITRYKDKCPVCGKQKGPHLSYVFADGSGLPYEQFTCSVECLKELTHNIVAYKALIPELNLYPDKHSYPMV